MTREKAIAALDHLYSTHAAGRWVDAFVLLGMLVLDDEPPQLAPCLPPVDSPYHWHVLERTIQDGNVQTLARWVRVNGWGWKFAGSSDLLNPEEAARLGWRWQCPVAMEDLI